MSGLRSVLLSLLLAPLQAPLVLGGAEFQANSVEATRSLMQWYNDTTGLWDTTSWWNSANAMTTIGYLTELEPQLEVYTRKIWNNTYYQAQEYNLKKMAGSLYGTATEPEAPPSTKAKFLQTLQTEFAPKVAPKVPSRKGFLNGYYDDEAWWALGWIKAYDVGGNPDYLRVAVDVFEDMVSTGYNASCGGVWWDRKRTYDNAIANELFLSLAAHLTNRMPNKKYYQDWTQRQWTWFQNTGMINSNGTINDGLDMTCKNNKKTIYSYNQGVILGALVEMSKIDKNPAYIEEAKKIAKGAMETLSDKDGVMHDLHERTSRDCFQFKGIFMRNLRLLYDATKEKWMKSYIEENAQSVWKNSRDSMNRLGPVWSGPFLFSNAATHSSALDVLVAASAVNR